MKEKIENPFTFDKMLDYFRSEMSDSDKPVEWEPEFAPALLFNAVKLGCNASQHKRLYEEIEGKNRQVIRETLRREREEANSRMESGEDHKFCYDYEDGRVDTYDRCLELLEN